MKTNINEELNYMKYLFGYKKGVVISEQSVVTNRTTINPEKETTEPKKEPKKDVNLQTPVGTPVEPTQQQTSQETNQQTQTDPTSDAQFLENQKQELEQKLSSIQQNLQTLNSKTELEQKQRLEAEIIKKIEDIDKYLRENCSKKMTKLCKEYLKEKSTYNSQIAQLRNLGTLPSPEEGDKKDAADKTTKWVGVASGILGLFSSVLATASTLKKD